jgi:hypothetical protein
MTKLAKWRPTHGKYRRKTYTCGPTGSSAALLYALDVRGAADESIIHLVQKKICVYLSICKKNLSLVESMEANAGDEARIWGRILLRLAGIEVLER